MTFWRPKNETPEDLEREEGARVALSDKYGIEIMKLSPELYNVDWAFIREGVVVAFAEYKWRKWQYDTLILSAAKVWKLQEYAKKGYSALVFVRFGSDPQFFYSRDSPETRYDLRLGGSSRGQNGDLEPVVHLILEAA